MSSESSDASKRNGASNAPPRPPLPLDEASKRADVPTFRCLVYLARTESGGVKARVANLPGIECRVANEREALAAIVPLFKQRIIEWLASETPIPWIEPSEPLAPGEQKRMIPVHL